MRCLFRCYLGRLLLYVPEDVDDELVARQSKTLHFSVCTRGGKSTKIFYSSKSTITLLKFYLSKSTSLKINSSKSKK